MRPKYQALYFGRSDSANEMNENPDEFVRSYVDLNDTLATVIAGRAFLVLGPKGTGKSALARYLEATEGNGSYLTLVRDASALPLDEVPRIRTGQPSGSDRTVTAWKFILLCNYLELLLRDQGSSLQTNDEVQRVAKLLRDFGFMGDAAGRALLRASSTTVSIPIPKIGTIYQKESRSNLNIYNLIPYMESWISEARSSVRHILLIDGLDSIFLNDEKYDASLSSLVQAAYSLNQKLRSRQATGSIVLLLRNDVFARISLSLPDSQKMRDDLSIDLDWRVLSGSAGANAPLLRLVSKKAGFASGNQNLDVLSYFPKDVEVGMPPKWTPSLQYLLNLTRHTPRDMLRLFEEIRKVEASNIFPASRDTLRKEVIREGVLQYSTKYFVGAIRNEFAGVSGGPETAQSAISALKNIARQSFSAERFREELKEVDASADADRILTLLFYAGAIGNHIAGRSNSYLQFYHRRDEAEIYLRGNFVLHNALVHAWNLPR